MNIAKYLKKLNWQKTVIYFILSLGLLTLMLYKLGSLTNGVSSLEVSSNHLPLGWHGLYHNPLYLPLNVLRSVVFFIFSHHTVFLLRLPSAILGLLTIISFSALVFLWHGKKTAYYTSIMFACSAWVLHVSRLSSNDIVYLWAITSVMLGYACLNEFKDSRLAWYFNILIIGLLATIPGLIWVGLLFVYFEKAVLMSNLKKLRLLEKLVSLILILIWLPLVILRLHPNHAYKQWLGLPEHFPSVLHLIKDFVAVPIHLLIRGPLNANLWLGKAPVLDAFALAMLLAGAYTYIRHYKNSRSRLLAALTLLSIILVGLNGSVSFSLIVPVAYLLIAMGISYLTHAWRKVFPNNPIAKWVGLTLIVVAIALSCAYNLRAYFIAWPHNPTTYTTFDRTI